MNRDSELKLELDNIFETFIEKRKYHPAIEDLLGLSEKYPDNDLINYYLGVCYSNTASHKKCLEYFNSIRRNTDDLSITQILQVYMLKGLAYTELNDLNNAELSFKEAIKINPGSSMSYSALGYVYYLVKKYDFAILNFKKALEEDPNNAGAHNNLGYTYAEIGINVGEAVKECKKAILFNPDSAAYHDSLGWAYYAASQYTESLKELKKALELSSGNNETIAGHLSLVMQRIEKANRKRK